MKRKGRTGLWLPPDPSDTIAGQFTGGSIATPSANAIKYVQLSLPGNAGDGSNVNAGLVGDFVEEIIAGTGYTGSPNPSFQYGTLADMSVGYSLKRVVGKLFVAIEQDNVADDVAGTWMVTAGIIVRRVDQNGDPVETDTFTDAYEATRDPWIWRRNWLLQNSGATPGANRIRGILPGSNAFYNSVADGPHVDQKTRRTVKSEERLFLDVSAIALDGTAAQLITTAYIVWDFRFFGRTFTSAGNRGNASR